MKHRLILAPMLALLLALPLLAASADTPAPARPQDGWVTLMSEDFEGVFPSPGWHIGREGDPYLWGQRNCHAHGGIYSMGGGFGGTLGSQIPCVQPYTTFYVTTLSYGPFDLTGCTDVRVNFAHLTALGAGDSLSYGYSIDGGKSWVLRFLYGDYISQCRDWCEWTIPADRFSIPLCGQPKVYLLFRFQSDAEGVGFGAWVDDVALEVNYDPPTLTPTPRGTIIPTVTPVRSATPTATRGATASRTPTRTPTATSTWLPGITPTLTRTVIPAAWKRIYLPLVLKATIQP